jgi:Zn-dependent M16 (insulinase) family peptidase
MINVAKLHQELLRAGIPIEGVAATEPPRIDFLPGATEEHRKQADTILAAHIPEDVEEKRRVAYAQRGVTAEAMVEALWEYIVEGRPEAVQKLQATRQTVQQ